MQINGLDEQSRYAHFDGFVLDLKTNELLAGGRSVAIPEQAVRVLRILVGQQGELVNRDEICSEIWGDRFVEVEAGLNTAIRSIRRALGDDAGEPRFIETITGRGYRFLPEVRFAANETTSTPRNRRYIVAAGIALLVVGGAALVFGLRLPEPPEDSTLEELASAGYEHFLHGQHALSRGNVEVAEERLRRAIEADPLLAPAYVSLARIIVYGRENGWQSIVEGQALVDEALRIDPELPAAHLLNAGLAVYYWRNRGAAQVATDNAMQFAAGEADAHVVTAYWLTIDGRFDEALEAIARAHEISPLSADLNADYGWVHYKARNWQDAERLCRTSVELNPQSAFALECTIHVNHSQGDHAEAAEFGQMLMALRGASAEQLALVRAIPDARQREQAFWQWQLDWTNENASEISNPYTKKALALTMLGRSDEAVATLREAYEHNGEPFLAFVHVDPRLDELRGHPEFPELADLARSAVPRD